jgi:hypothetical protein
MDVPLAAFVVCLGATGFFVIRRVGSESFPHGWDYWRVLVRCSVAAAVVGLISIMA